MKLFTHKSSASHKLDAQANLIGITHYVDDSTMRFHHSRVLQFDIHANGLLCSIIESVSLDMNNTRRGFRYVVFDVFGTVISRASLDDCVTSKAIARKQLAAYIKSTDAVTHTLAAIDRNQQYHIAELNNLRATIGELPVKRAA